ncbi:hypothetical protein NUS45_06660 [Glaesserella parasuis]|nr:hypothetical protein [Glaesserella parasuis]MCT8813346.1 hypothetical protein [Glaesserella parasuis]MCT8829513.1 hypothetical protein [Glaesserella parasuis]MCT8829526.1 hypothetical protein [Glaesserella parasuis]MCT8834043.1 hypothetical protein [Glaesserella parasuis]
MDLIYIILGIVGFVVIAWIYFAFFSVGMEPSEEIFEFCVFLGLFFLPVTLYWLRDIQGLAEWIILSACLVFLVLIFFSPFIFIGLLLLESFANCISSLCDEIDKSKKRL